MKDTWKVPKATVYYVTLWFTFVLIPLLEAQAGAPSIRKLFKSSIKDTLFSRLSRIEERENTETRSS